MTNRYLLTEWVALKRRLPLSIRNDVGEIGAPPKYVLVSFASVRAKEYIEAQLGPSIEPNKSYDLLEHKAARRKKDESYVYLPDPEND
jgi:hypothetical protein